MSFIDKVRIFVKAGDGGNGCLSFRREKFLEFGGPDGGDGGKGGGVWLEASTALTTLMDFAHRPHIHGKDGSAGKGGNKKGLAGEDLVLKVPLGTVVYKDGRSVCDLSAQGQRFLAAPGGRGGRGNLSFKTRLVTAPRLYEKGAPGEKAELELELKLIADVGLVGLPNAGKSTLLSRLTRARPKIAPYPFTTLDPHLGVASHKGIHFVMADVPGLIEGAHKGKGLGLDFLRHIERTRLLVHLVDPSGFSGLTAAQGVKVLEGELKAYSARLRKKPRLLVVSKLDLPEGPAALKKLSARGALGISSATGEGMEPFLDRLILELSRAEPPQAMTSGAPRDRDVRVDPGFSVSPMGGGRYRLSGSFVERAAAMLDVSLPEAVDRFQRTLKRIGVDRALKRAGIEAGDLVSCGDFEFEWSDRPYKALPAARRHKRTRIGVGKA